MKSGKKMKVNNMRWWHNAKQSKETRQGESKDMLYDKGSEVFIVKRSVQVEEALQSLN